MNNCGLKNVYFVYCYNHLKFSLNLRLSLSCFTALYHMNMKVSTFSPVGRTEQRGCGCPCPLSLLEFVICFLANHEQARRTRNLRWSRWSVLRARLRPAAGALPETAASGDDLAENSELLCVLCKRKNGIRTRGNGWLNYNKNYISCQKIYCFYEPYMINCM